MRIVSVLACFVVTVLAVRTAVAQPGMTPVASIDEGADRALAVSLGGAIGSTALLGAGIAVYARGGDGEGLVVGGTLAGLFAPSMGHWAADKFLTRGFWLRMAGLGFAGLGGIAAICGGFGWEEDGDDECDHTSTKVLLGIAAVFYVGGMVDDVVTVRGRIRTHNRRMHGLALVPAPMRGGGGLALRGTF